MARTISQIAGEYGLNRNTTGDPFARSEEAVSAQILKNLQETRSQQEEINASKGFGRSTFSDQISAKKVTDTLGQTGVAFAQARTTEDLRERDFERNLISTAVSGDIQKELVQESGQVQEDLIKKRAEENRLTTLGGVTDTGETVDGTIARSAEEQRTNIEKQYEELTKSQKELIPEQTNAARNLQLGEADPITGERTGGTIAAQYTASANAQMDVLDKQLENLPEELSERKTYMTGVLNEKLALERQDLINTTAINATVNAILSLTDAAGAFMNDDGWNLISGWLNGGNDSDTVGDDEVNPTPDI